MDDIHQQCVRQVAEINEDSIFYIATPFTSKSPEVEESRMVLSTLTASFLKEQFNLTMILPITMSYQLVRMNHRLGSDWETWGNDDLKLLSKCGALIVLTLMGWDESYGVEQEINYARENKMPIYYYDPYCHEFATLELPTGV